MKSRAAVSLTSAADGFVAQWPQQNLASGSRPAALALSITSQRTGPLMWGRAAAIATRIMPRPERRDGCWPETAGRPPAQLRERPPSARGRSARRCRARARLCSGHRLPPGFPPARRPSATPGCLTALELTYPRDDSHLSSPVASHGAYRAARRRRRLWTGVESHRPALGQRASASGARVGARRPRRPPRR